MKPSNRVPNFRTAVLPVLFAAVLAGCSKQAEQTTTTTPVATPATAPGAAAVVDPSPAAVADAQRMFAEADAALKAKEYKKAVEAMLAAQQQRLTEQQSLQSRDRMIQLQSALAGAAASGNAEAKAAVQRLRESATY